MEQKRSVHVHWWIWTVLGLDGCTREYLYMLEPFRLSRFRDGRRRSMRQL